MGQNTVADYIRLFVIVFGFIVMLQSAVSAWDEARNYDDTDPHRIAFHMMILISMIVAVGTEWGRLGHEITWRLPLNVLLTCLGCYSLWFRMPWVKSRREYRNNYHGYLVGREDTRRHNNGGSKYWKSSVNPLDDYDPYDLKNEVRRN